MYGRSVEAFFGEVAILVSLTREREGEEARGKEEKGRKNERVMQADRQGEREEGERERGKNERVRQTDRQTGGERGES